MKETRGNSWPRKKLGSLCSINRGSSPRPIADIRYFEGGTIPWVKIADATKSGKFLYETKQHVNDFGASFSRRLPPGTILVAASGTLGYTQILGVEGCAHDGWLIIQELQDLDRDFLYYVLKTLEQHFFASASGAAIQNINTDILRETVIPHPPLPTQRRIAGILSAYDDLIENNLRRIKILEEMAQSLYREWFVHFRFPGHEGVPLVDSPLGPIPVGWEVKVIDEVAIVHRGRSYRSKELVENGGVPFVNLKCIERDGGFRRDGIKSYDGPFKELQRVRCGDIVMAVTDMTQERRIVARAARVPELEGGFGVISMDLVSIEVRLPELSDFLYSYFRCSDFADHLKQFANGANVLHLSPGKIRDHRFIMPNRSVARHYAEVVSVKFAQIENLHQRNNVLRQTRDLLLPKLLQGEIGASNTQL
jgi:type I restriction enzyme S subunit